MQLDNNQQAFFELLRAGLWEKDARLSHYKNINFSAIMRLAEEQSVVGLLTAGLEKVSDIKIPKDVILQFVGSTLQIERQNKAMNAFIADLIEKLRKEDIYTLLVKGQGIAQCYEKPLWRSSGDVDLLLNDSNYEKAKYVLLPLVTSVETEYTHFKHAGMTIDGWIVELHGILHSRLSRRVDNMIDNVQADVFYGGKVRSWMNGSCQVFLPAPDEDVIFVFTHILHHFFYEGIGLRQLCDWCRLLWVYRSEIDVKLLEKRLRKAGLMTEWKAFAAFVVEYIGMPGDRLPLFSNDERWQKKAKGILECILVSGNFGHNKDCSYQNKYNYRISKIISFFKHTIDQYTYFKMFPLTSMKTWWNMVITGTKIALKGV